MCTTTEAMTSPSPPSTKPKVLHPIETADFIHWLLDHCTPPSTLLVAHRSQDFLLEILGSEQHNERQKLGTSDSPPGTPTRPYSRLGTSLSQLKAAEHIQTTYLSSKVLLSFYLAGRGPQAHQRARDEASGLAAAAATATAAAARAADPPHPRRQPILALLNPICLHRGTPHFSAQGLSRTFAAAVEAAARNGQRLVVAECPSRVTAEVRQMVLAGPEPLRLQALTARAEEERAAAERDADEGYEGLAEEGEDPWEVEVGILNVTTRRFGGGERGWVGRTVKARAVAERWFEFERVDLSG